MKLHRFGIHNGETGAEHYGESIACIVPAVCRYSENLPAAARREDRRLGYDTDELPVLLPEEYGADATAFFEKEFSNNRLGHK